MTGLAPALHCPQPVIAAVDPYLLADEVSHLPKTACLASLACFQVFIASSESMPNVVREIGRLREISFRAVGEGTGLALDIDRYDTYYQHLFVWNPETHQVIGSYRVGFTSEIVAKYGVTGLYTHSLFEFGTSLFDRLGPCLELGRSFVRPEWQRNSQALRLLWSGILVLLSHHPELKNLFGSVSVSSRFSEFARLLIMSSLQLHHTDDGLKPLVRARNAPVLERRHHWYQRVTEVSAGLADPQVLSQFLQCIEQGMALPMLIKHYIALKGRFAGFNLDASFNNTLDGLVFVRVADIPERLRARLARGQQAGAV